MGDEYNLRKDIDRFKSFLDNLEDNLMTVYGVKTLPDFMKSVLDESEIKELVYTKTETDNLLTNKVSTSDLLDLTYPIGTVYSTTDDEFDPSETFGGTWKSLGELITGIYAWERIQ